MQASTTHFECNPPPPAGTYAREFRFLWPERYIQGEAVSSMANRRLHLLTAAAYMTCLSLPAVAATGSPDNNSADAAEIAHGEYLARVGDCVACHTASGGKPFAGGQMMESPFGKIASSNITPDPDTGIGKWTEAQFYAALHKGIAADGSYIYPAMPYQWFTKVTPDDVHAIWVYLKSVPPVHAPDKPNDLIFPFNIRAGIGGWNALYFKEGTFKPDTSKPADWNRGAYLVEGLGHCADCHTPKNAAQAPIESEAFAGGKIDDWFAPNISSDPKEGIGTWSADTIVSYLKKGGAPGKGVAIGPMAQTVHDSLSHLTDPDLHDIALYLKSLPPKSTYKISSVQSEFVHNAGAQVYYTNCASCHQPNGQGLGQDVPPLANNGAVIAKGPENVIRAVLGGLRAQDSYGPMPGFATVLTPQQVADVVNYVRTSWGNGAPATATAELVASLQPRTDTMIAATHWCQNPGGDKVGDVVKDPASGVPEALRKITDNMLLPQIKQIVGDVKRAAPGAKKDDVVNQLTAAYCPVVFKDKSIPPDQRAPKLDEFASLVYTVLSDPGKM